MKSIKITFCVSKNLNLYILFKVTTSFIFSQYSTITAVIMDIDKVNVNTIARLVRLCTLSYFTIISHIRGISSHYSDVSNHRKLDCLLKASSSLRQTNHQISALSAIDAESVSMWWHHMETLSASIALKGNHCKFAFVSLFSLQDYQQPYSTIH